MSSHCDCSRERFRTPNRGAVTSVSIGFSTRGLGCNSTPQGGVQFCNGSARKVEFTLLNAVGEGRDASVQREFRGGLSVPFPMLGPHPRVRLNGVALRLLPRWFGTCRAGGVGREKRVFL
jgi:hypothetical protein